MATQDSDGARTVHRVVALLLELERAQGAGLTAMNLAEKCSLTRSTTHRLLAALRANGFITQPRSGRHYYLGHKIYKLGLVALPQLGIQEICADVIESLAILSESISFLTIRSGLDGVCIDRCDKNSCTELQSVEIGCRRALGIGLGSIAILAGLPNAECEQVIRSNSSRYNSWKDGGISYIRVMVNRTRRYGFAVTASDYISNIGGFAVSIRDLHSKQVFAAISVASSTERMPLSRASYILPLLRNAASEIEKRLASRKPLNEGDP